MKLAAAVSALLLSSFVAGQGEGRARGLRRLQNGGINDGEYECQVREAIYDSPVSVPSYNNETDAVDSEGRRILQDDDDDLGGDGGEDTALHCVSDSDDGPSYEIDGLTEEDEVEIRKKLRDSDDGTARIAFKGAGIGKKKGGEKIKGGKKVKRAGTAALLVPKAVESDRGKPTKSWRAVDDKPGKKGKGPNKDGKTERRDGQEERRHRSLALNGDRTLIVIRVSSPDGNVTASSSQLSDEVFGTHGGNLVNTAERMSSCSYGKFTLDKPPNDNVAMPALVDGVVDVFINDNIGGRSSGDVFNMAKPLAAAALGVPLGTFSHRLYVLPGHVSFGGAAAWAYLPGSDSVFLNGYASSTFVQMHELGHNIGLMHSGESGAGYGDITGYMGARWNDAKLCYNAQKSSFLGWYDDRKSYVDLSQPSTSLTVRLFGIADYGDSSSLPSNYAALVRVGTPGTDVHLMYNRAKGLNAGTQEKGDQVTVVEGEPYQGHQSWLLAGLSPPNGRFVRNQFGGTANPLIVDVTGVGVAPEAPNATVDYVDVTVSNMCDDDVQCDNWATCAAGTCDLSGGGICLSSGLLPDCCGNGICEPDNGERCSTCPNDCCGENLALGKNATQSTTAWGGVAEKAVDGDLNGNWGAGSVTHTNAEPQDWWMVDLGQDYLVNTIRIYNRVDCCGSRLSDFDVRILDDTAQQNVVAELFHAGGAGSSKIITFEDSNRDGYVGRYLQIQLRSSEALSLAEVQVFAANSQCGNDICDPEESCSTCASDCCTPNVALGKVATQSTTAHGGVPGRAVDGDANGNWAANSVSHTDAECNAWWKVDLADDAPPEVSVVRLYNRQDCCANRLHDVTVQVLDAAENLIAENVHPGVLGWFTESTFDKGVAIGGKYVKIVNGCNGNQPLQLAEVEVFGNVDATPMPSAEPTTAAPVTPAPVTSSPTMEPSSSPSASPSATPTTASPTTIEPTSFPSSSPSAAPTQSCGDGVCDAASSETCSTCASDCCPGNLALGQPVSQSTTEWGGVPERAVDGDQNGYWNAGSVSHTGVECGAWWTVDLGRDAEVGTVLVYNRQDGCCWDRLRDFTVQVLDSDQTTVVAENSHSGPAPRLTDSTFANGAVGRYVKITNGCDQVLSLAEVEVYSKSGGNVGALVETWYGVGGGNIADLTSDPRYPSSPDDSYVTYGLETSPNRADAYGTRMRCYVVPPETGTYTFWIATDDAGELYLSGDDDPANKSQVAFVTGWVGHQAWDTQASQKSDPVSLVKGRRYYLEALQKDGGGGDHLSVAWESAEAGIGRSVVGTAYTRVYTD
mmetsp:Transcript_8240/g.15079  ORF Transcript_8240/g.15079 Transcript_8240/m.15079 type:complete len:1302 (-) Transcript_8240:105-4010(-)